MKSGQADSFDKNSYISKVNPTVLRMIHHKKYPLSEEKFLKIQKKKQKCQVNPTCSLRPLNRFHFNSNSTHNLKNNLRKQKQQEKRTIGDHLLYQGLRYQAEPLRVSQQMYDVNDRLNVYIWERKKQILNKHMKTQRNLKTSGSNGLLRHSGGQLPSMLKKIRKKMLNQPINDLTEDQLSRKSHFIENNLKVLLSQQQGKGEPLERREQQLKRWRKKEKENIDDEARMAREMLKELQESRTSDRFCKMRIVLNHRKIISMG